MPIGIEADPPCAAMPTGATMAGDGAGSSTPRHRPLAWATRKPPRRAFEQMFEHHEDTPGSPLAVNHDSGSDVDHLELDDPAKINPPPDIGR